MDVQCRSKIRIIKNPLDLFIILISFHRGIIEIKIKYKAIYRLKIFQEYVNVLLMEIKFFRLD